MLDDVIAGVYANIGTRVTLWLIATYLPSLLAI
jgi:phosphatidylglycerophosphatase A